MLSLYGGRTEYLLQKPYALQGKNIYYLVLTEKKFLISGLGHQVRNAFQMDAIVSAPFIDHDASQRHISVEVGSKQ